MKKNRIDIITMGCSKNLVDSEALMRLLSKKGYDCHHDADVPQGEYVVINTCGFIEDAKQESIDTILELIEAKERGQIGKLYVMGCLSQRYQDQLEKEIPEVDKYYGKFNFKQLASDLPDATMQIRKQNVCTTSTPSHYAYVKISEGCDRHCAYCAIPIITGKHVSRSQEEILDEVRMLVANGVSEFQIIAQELTYYGIDIDGKQHIAELVDKMADIPGVRWIRLHYAYPTHFPYDLLDVMRKRDNVCKYLDIALQHISTPVLERMQRHIDKDETYELIKCLREEVPGICLRTTLMVGFPGETEDDFNELMDFVRWARFERMGAFAYSEEEGTPSADKYADDVNPDVKQRRLDKLMELQQQISAEIAESCVGKEMMVVIDRREGEYYVGRSQYSSPEVDPEVLLPVSERQLRRGHYYKVKINAADDFDLYATVVK